MQLYEEGLILQEAIYFALAKTNNTQIKLKEEQKEAIRQIVNGRDVKSLIYQLLPSMFDYINSRKRNISAVLRPETIHPFDNYVTTTQFST
jgi:hypothetical protein